MNSDVFYICDITNLQFISIVKKSWNVDRSSWCIIKKKQSWFKWYSKNIWVHRTIEFVIQMIIFITTHQFLSVNCSNLVLSTSVASMWIFLIQHGNHELYFVNISAKWAEDISPLQIMYHFDRKRSTWLYGCIALQIPVSNGCPLMCTTSPEYKVNNVLTCNTHIQLVMIKTATLPECGTNYLAESSLETPSSADKLPRL